AFQPIPKCGMTDSVMAMIAFRRWPYAIARDSLPNMKSDLAARLLLRSHQLPDRIDDRGDLFVMFANAFFEVRTLSGELPVCFERLPQFHERAHDGDIHLHSALALKHTR